MVNKTHSDVRMALPADIEPIIDLLREMQSETGIGRFDDDRVLQAVITGIARQGGVVGVVRGGGGGVEASIGLFIGTNWYSSDPHLFDLWSYVGAPYRKTTHQKSMIEFAKRAALEANLPLLMTVIGNEQTERKEQLFRRQLPRAGTLFLFNAPRSETVNA